MGLLDVFDDPGARLGIGLLAAAAPRFDNAGFGQRLAEGVEYLDQFKQQQAKQKFMDMQMQNLQSEIDARKSAQEKQQRMQEMISGMFGGPVSATTALGAGASVGDVGPTVTNAARMNGTGSGGGIASMTPNQLALLKANGLDLTDVYKLTRPNLTNVSGTMVDTTDPANVGKFIADPTKGMDFKGGKVSVLPGFLESQDAITGGQAAAQERAKAGLDLVSVPQSDGTTRMMPRSAAVQALNQPQITNVGNKQPSAQDLAIIQADALKNGIVNPVVNFNNNAPALGVTQNPAQAEYEKVTAKGAADRANQSETDAKKFAQMTAGLTDAMNLLSQNPTQSGAGSLYDRAANFVGISPTGSEQASKLKTLSGWLVANVPRMEGPQSDKDVENYRQMAGLIGDDTVPVKQRLAAAQTVQQLQQKYADLNGYSGKQEQGQKPQAPKMLNDLPAANASNKGMRIRDTTTGKILQSNGIKWVEQ